MTGQETETGTSRTIYQGEFVISDKPGEQLVTILGSCVAACLYDPVRAIGGLNHFLLPHAPQGSGPDLRYGIHSMELLINSLLRQGASRNRLVAKLFGGARMIDEFTDIGKSNAEFALDFLKAESIPCLASSLGGNQARRVRFWPATGKAQQMLVARTETPPKVTPQMVRPTAPAPDITLF